MTPVQATYVGRLELLFLREMSIHDLEGSLEVSLNF
jgi:hypothetical protein